MSNDKRQVAEPKPRIKLVHGPFGRRARWTYEPRCARENLCTWAWNWCTERNVKEGRP